MTRELLRQSLVFLAPLLLVGLISSCSSNSDNSNGGDTNAAQSTLEKVKQENVIRIGYANEAPYAYLDTAENKVTGEAPEIARVVAAELGVENVEGVLTEFGSLIPGLKAGKFDIIAAGMYILPKRCEQVDFSNPTYAIGEAMAVAAGNPKGINSYTDVRDNEDITLGIVSGTVEIGYADAIGIPKERIRIFDDAPKAVAAVRAGRIDAYAGTALTVQDLVDKDSSGNVERAQPFEQPIIDGEAAVGYGAFAFRQDDDELREAFNEKLAELIGTPEHLELVRPFGFTERELPGDKTAEMLCGAGE